MVKAKKFVLARHFKGAPRIEDFVLLQEEMPPLEDGEILLQAEYLSVDPYMRKYTDRHPIGGTIVGNQVARVVETKSIDWKIGDRIVGHFGWRTFTIYDPSLCSETSEDPLDDVPKPYKLPPLGSLPSSLGLGALGMPGNSAYFGLLEICKPKHGETVVVSGAAGGVGSIVGQIAKIYGCRVIGFTGTNEKVGWLEDELGFDAAYNYKKVSVGSALDASAPHGVDCYFDNVGGDISSEVIFRMNHGGRIAVCGSISASNVDSSELPKVPVIQRHMVRNELKMEGFIVYRWTDRWMEGIDAIHKWIEEGKIKYQQTITRGFDNMPFAFIGMLRGDNRGKAVVQV